MRKTKYLFLAVFAGFVSMRGFASGVGDEAVYPSVASVEGSVDDLNSGDISGLAGEWVIYNLRGDKITVEDRPYIDIQPGENRFYGSNGCNILNGDISASGNDGIRFRNIISTQRFCSDAPFEYLINTTLEDVRYYSLKRHGHESYLDLMNDGRHVIMVLRHHNMNFLNGAWRVTKIDGAVNHNENVEMVIDIPQARIHGNAGCNIMNGSLYIDPDKSNSVQFQEIVTTRTECPDMSAETSLLVALEEVEKAYLNGPDEVAMYDGRGQEVVVLKRIYVNSSGNARQ